MEPPAFVETRGGIRLALPSELYAEELTGLVIATPIFLDEVKLEANIFRSAPSLRFHQICTNNVFVRSPLQQAQEAYVAPFHRCMLLPDY